ncbi:MAG: phosphatidylserine/phosphatidylglycerophosphate/cardiolipin synthase family protein [Verrucomicrobiota bacterium]
MCPCLFVTSCSNVSTNARSTTERGSQSTDSVSGTGNLVKTTVRATAMAALQQPVTTARLGLTVVWQRPGDFLRRKLGALVPDAMPAAPGSLEFEQELDRRSFPPAESGSLKWLVDGPQFYPEFDRQIAAARSSVDVQVFIFDNDDIGVRYAKSLQERAAAIPVRVLFDDLGSTMSWTSAPETAAPKGFQAPSDMEAFLTAGNSDTRVRRTINPWLACDHTKLIVFDQRSAILGGMNIGREYFSEWHDLMVRVDGPVVATLARDFHRSWRKAGPLGDFGLFRKPISARKPAPFAGGVPIRVLRTDPAEGRLEILDAMMLAIRGARQRVWIENPYFSHDGISEACEDAARRGVDVRVIIPAAGDSAIMDAGNLATARSLISAGATVLRYPKMTHMKVMICDDWATAGSANLDILSLRINRELNLAFSHPDTVRALEEAVFSPDFKRSREMTLAETTPTEAALGEVISATLADHL